MRLGEFHGDAQIAGDTKQDLHIGRQPPAVTEHYGDCESPARVKEEENGIEEQRLVKAGIPFRKLKVCFGVLIFKSKYSSVLLVSYLESTKIPPSDL
jgi:hypothetical protein